MYDSGVRKNRMRKKHILQSYDEREREIETQNARKVGWYFVAFCSNLEIIYENQRGKGGEE